MTKEKEITLLYQLIEKHFGSGVLMQFEDLTETDNDQLLNRIETMTTYNSYEAAKIANPSEDIYATKMSMGGRVEVFGVYVIIANITSNYHICDPSKYCMTVDKFLYDGHEFVEGDVYLNSDGRTLGVVNIPEYNNKRSTIDCNLYILRAAALETKEQKRTKVEYVNIGRDWNAWEFLKAYSELPDSEQWFIKVSDDQYMPIHDWFVVAKTLRAHNLVYQRIETPIEWWEDANDLLGELANLSLDDDGVLQLTMEKGQVGFGMSRDKWCDFARILLEQGE